MFRYFAPHYSPHKLFYRTHIVCFKTIDVMLQATNGIYNKVYHIKEETNPLCAALWPEGARFVPDDVGVIVCRI